jgi:hypothetical protein
MDFQFDFLLFKSVSSMFCLKLLLIKNFKTLLAKMTFGSTFVFKMVSCTPKKSIG